MFPVWIPYPNFGRDFIPSPRFVGQSLSSLDWISARSGSPHCHPELSRYHVVRILVLLYRTRTLSRLQHSHDFFLVAVFLRCFIHYIPSLLVLYTNRAFLIWCLWYQAILRHLTSGDGHKSPVHCFPRV